MKRVVKKIGDISCDNQPRGRRKILSPSKKGECDGVVGAWSLVVALVGLVQDASYCVIYVMVVRSIPI